MLIKYNLLKSAITAFALSTCIAPSFAESVRFEVSNNVLIDNKLKLEWQKLIFDEADLLNKQEIGNLRIATLSEVSDIFPSTFPFEGRTISKLSDIYTAFEFFSSSADKSYSCNTFGVEATCFAGYSLNVSGEKFVSASSIKIESIPNDLNNSYYKNYTVAGISCTNGIMNCSKIPMFTVREVPEPSTLSLLLLGVLGLSFVMRRNTEQQSI
jgi:PEP-CTERM motif